MAEQDASKDFFISYNRHDRAWAEWIAQQLEQEGYSIIIQAWDFAPGMNFPLKMHEALKSTRRTLLVLSPTFLTSEYTAPEWAGTFVKDPQGLEALVVPVRVRECHPDGLLAALAYIDLVGLDEMVARQELLNGIRPHPRPSRSLPFPGSPFQQAQVPSFPGNWPLLWTVPYRRNPFFIGREQLLQALHDQLRPGTTTALTQAQAIHGLGGIGKTQTAVEYAYRHKQEYQLVLWVRAGARDTLVADLVTIAGALRLSEQQEQDQNQVVEAVKHWLERQSDWLLIFDNADDLRLVSEFLPNTEMGYVLLTTRDQAVELMAQSQEVEKMDLAEGVALLLRRAGVLGQQDPLQQARVEDRAAAEAIVEMMDGLPLAIDQAGAYIAQMKCGLSRYLQLYELHRADLLKWRRRVPSDYPSTVVSTWTLSFEQVQVHSQAAADLLRLCAFLDPDAIAEDLFTDGAEELTPALAAVARDAFQLDETLDVLRAFSLIRRLPDNRSLAIHRLVQVVLKEQMDLPTQQQWAQRTVRMVNAAFPEVEFESQSRCQQLLPHALICADLIKQYSLAFPEVSRLLHQVEEYFRLGELTRREAELLHLVVRGYRNREVAQKLHISERTVYKHLQSIQRKLELPTRHMTLEKGGQSK